MSFSEHSVWKKWKHPRKARKDVRMFSSLTMTDFRLLWSISRLKKGAGRGGTVEDFFFLTFRGDFHTESLQFSYKRWLIPNINMKNIFRFPLRDWQEPFTPPQLLKFKESFVISRKTLDYIRTLLSFLHCHEEERKSFQLRLKEGTKSPTQSLSNFAKLLLLCLRLTKGRPIIMTY